MIDCACASVCLSVCLVCLLVSAPSQGVYYFLSMTVCLSSVAPSVTANFKLIFLFCFLTELSHFLAVISPYGTLQNVVLRFWFRPPNAQNLLSKFWQKWPITRLVRQINRRRLGLLGGFWGWWIQWNHTKCCESTLVAMAMKFWQIWAIFAQNCL